ncbi:MAG: hypothetical protein CMJ19_15160 [Phycisphaeraceae bacterium]|nr:hypothetical protein [Phycisphaeraceae bacterium]
MIVHVGDASKFVHNFHIHRAYWCIQVHMCGVIYILPIDTNIRLILEPSNYLNGVIGILFIEMENIANVARHFS